LILSVKLRCIVKKTTGAVPHRLTVNEIHTVINKFSVSVKTVFSTSIKYNAVDQSDEHRDQAFASFCGNISCCSRDWFPLRDNRLLPDIVFRTEDDRHPIALALRA
jgi:hypothetical protein